MKADNSNNFAMHTTHTIFVTGSSRGIGKSIALRLAKEGYHIVLHCRSQLEEALQVQAQIEALGVKARVLQFDLQDRDKVAQVLIEDIEKWGCYYGVVCNAGLAKDAIFPAMTGADWDSVLRTNLDGFFNVLNPLILPMIQRRKPGRIVSISSVSGVKGNKAQVNYSAAKAGIIGATKALALELATRNITVNCVAPGLIETDMLQDMDIKPFLDGIPMRRIGKPEEVAAVVAFLMREEASYITRQVISVDGGMA